MMELHEIIRKRWDISLVSETESEFARNDILDLLDVIDRVTAERDALRNGAEMVSYGLAYQEMQETIDALTRAGTNVELCLTGIMQVIAKGWQTGDMGDASDLVIRATEALTAWNYALGTDTNPAVGVQP